MKTVNKKMYQALTQLEDGQLLAVPTYKGKVLDLPSLPVRFSGPLVPTDGSKLICDDLVWTLDSIADGILVYGGSILGQPWHSNVTFETRPVIRAGEVIRVTYTVLFKHR